MAGPDAPLIRLYLFSRSSGMLDLKALWHNNYKLHLYVLLHAECQEFDRKSVNKWQGRALPTHSLFLMIIRFNLWFMAKV